MIGTSDTRRNAERENNPIGGHLAGSIIRFSFSQGENVNALDSLFRRLLDGDGTARDELIKTAMPVAETIANKLCRDRRVPRDDLVSDAYLALVEAVGALPSLRTSIYDVRGFLAMRIVQRLKNSRFYQPLIRVPRTTRRRLGEKAPVFKQSGLCPEAFEAGDDDAGDGIGLNEILKCCRTGLEQEFVEQRSLGASYEEVAEQFGKTVRQVQAIGWALKKRLRESVSATAA
ncbi:MAG TPA: hypothetical protein VHX65_16710 [Pirellulales bacterium]|jgi:DNA-directed RNA polymerase specialized sigma24 family protein|nr:hypothetical protein [Pirellulales bacterium]